MIDNGADLRFSGTEEFLKKMGRISQEYPKVAEKHLRAAGNQLKKMVIEATPVGKTEETFKKRNKKTGLLQERKSKRKLKNTWTGKVEGFSGDTLEYQLRSTSRRFHLVERGHLMIRKGKLFGKGEVKGKFFFKREVTRFNQSGIIGRQLQKFMREIGRKMEAGK